MFGDLVEMGTDSSGAKSFASWRGSGRIRHIEVKWLWLQQVVADVTFRPAHIVTKYKGLRDQKEEQLKRVNGCVVARGRDRGGDGCDGSGELAFGGRASEVRM